MLFKPIGLCGTIKTPKNFRTPPTYFDPPLPRRSSDVRFAIWKNFFLSTDLCNSSFSSSHWVDQCYKKDHGSKTYGFSVICTLIPLDGVQMGRMNSNVLFTWDTLQTCSTSRIASHAIFHHSISLVPSKRFQMPEWVSIFIWGSGKTGKGQSL